MSLKFPISLVGKRAASITTPSVLYTGNGGVLAEIDGDIPDGFNNEEELYNPASLSIGSSCGSIGSYAFGYNSNLTTIDTLNPPPPTLTSIGDYAFVDTPITGSVFLPSTLDLGVGVFYGTNITDVTIEMETLGNTADGYGAFESCGNIESVTLLDSCKNLYGPVFYDTRPDQSGGTAQFTLDLGSVVNIGAIGSDYGPFEYSGAIGNLNLPNTVEIIGDNAFIGSNGLTGTLTIPDSVTYIGDYAFEDCSGFNGSLTLPNNPNLTGIGDYAFSGSNGLTGTLTIPDSVTSIGSGAFKTCSGLTSLTIGNSVTSIGDYSFYFCTNLFGTLTIPDSVKTIGDWAFNACIGLDGTLTIPDSVTSIGSTAFGYAFSVNTLVIGSGVTSISSNAFYGNFSLTAVYTNCPASSFTGTNAFFLTNFTTIYTGPNATGYTSSFQGRTGLTIANWDNYPNI